MKTTKEKIEDAIEATGLLMTVTEKQDAAQAALDAVCEELAGNFYQEFEPLILEYYPELGCGGQFAEVDFGELQSLIHKSLKAAADKLRG